MRQISLLFLTLFTLGLANTGCVRFAPIEVIPSDCLNPASGICPSSGPAANSNVLKLRLYQLKDEVSPCTLDYTAFNDGMDKEFDVLKAQLTDPQRKDLVRSEDIEPAKSKSLVKLQLLPATRYILAVAVGYKPGRNSIQLIDRARATEGLVFYIRGTDLCLDSSCESSQEVGCRR